MSPASANPQKIILDTDPGIDDAMAILYAIAHPALDLVGLTTTFGNVSVRQATQNALLLAQLAGCDVPVACGASAPMVRDPRPYPAFVHGNNGLGDQNLAAPCRAPIEQRAAEFIVDTVLGNPGDVTLVAIGPLTNLAAALSLQPNIARDVKQVVIMGGAVHVAGNVSPVAEANIFCDPDAARIVFDTEWPITLASLDVTNHLLMDRALFQRIGAANAKAGAILQHGGEFYIDFHERFTGESLCRGHDVAAVAALTNPQLFETQSGRVRVATEGIATGETLFAPEGHRYGDAWDGGASVAWLNSVQATSVVRDFEYHLSSEFWG
jgi:purine nucleosidase